MTLRYLWEDNIRWAQHTLYHVDARAWLCYFAVAEGLDDLVLNWVKADLPAGALELFDLKAQQDLWRGFSL